MGQNNYVPLQTQWQRCEHPTLIQAGTFLGGHFIIWKTIKIERETASERFRIMQLLQSYMVYDDEEYLSGMNTGFISEILNLDE